jgi:hypothetical protein
MNLALGRDNHRGGRPGRRSVCTTTSSSARSRTPWFSILKLKVAYNFAPANGIEYGDIVMGLSLGLGL